MRRPLTLHIGISKTGTSSIQRVLAAHRDALRGLGVYYPASPGWANHALLPASLVNNPRILWGFHPGTWEGMSPAARLERFRDEWAAEMAALPDWAERVIISAEQISMLLRHEDEVTRLAAMLAPHFDPVTVVVYLRRQDLHAASAYSQWLRGGVLVEPGLPSGGPAELPEYDYGGLIGRYARAFGAAAVVPRLFDRAELAGGDVVEDFLRVAGLTLAVPDEVPGKSANLSLSREGQRLLLTMGRTMAARTGDDSWRDTPVWRRLAETVSNACPGKGWQPTRAEAREFLSRFAEGNEQVRAAYFPGRAALFPDDFDALPERQANAADADRLAETALAVLLHEGAAGAARDAQAALAQFRLLRRQGDRAGARAAVVRAVKFAPDLLAARLRAAEFFLEENDVRQAAEHHAAAAKLGADDEHIARLGRRIARARRDAALAAGAPRSADVPDRHQKREREKDGHGTGLHPGGGRGGHAPRNAAGSMGAA